MLALAAAMTYCIALEFICSCSTEGYRPRVTFPKFMMLCASVRTNTLYKNINFIFITYK